MSHSRRSRLSRKIALPALALALSIVATTFSASTSTAAVDRQPSAQHVVDSAQAELDRIMALQPGGVQVSDNAVVWGNADAVLVVPDAGESVAPDGLGENVRAAKLTTRAMRRLDASSSTAKLSAADDPDYHGCPGGWAIKDYYCFYQYRGFGGRRMQFTGATSAGVAEEWGFNNGTSAWLSRDVDCTVYAYRHNIAGSGWMWKQPENSRSSWVGPSNDNAMSKWTCP